MTVRQLPLRLVRVLLHFLPGSPFSHNAFQGKMWLEGTSHAHLKARAHELITWPLNVWYCSYLLCVRGETASLKKRVVTEICKFQKHLFWGKNKSLGLITVCNFLDECTVLFPLLLSITSLIFLCDRKSMQSNWSTNRCMQGTPWLVYIYVLYIYWITPRWSCCSGWHPQLGLQKTIPPKTTNRCYQPLLVENIPAPNCHRMPPIISEFYQQAFPNR